MEHLALVSRAVPYAEHSYLVRWAGDTLNTF